VIQEGFEITYNKNEISQLMQEQEDLLIVTQKDIWEAVSARFIDKPDNLYYIESLELDFLDQFVKEYSHFKKVVGLGGGRAADVAKYLQWKGRVTLYQIPTILSVDAFFTHEVAIRQNGVVKYIGNAVPEKVFIDTDLIQSAPIALNRSGIGDILSCHTGLYDWKIASDAGIEPLWDISLAEKTEKLLSEVLENSEEIREVSEKGIRLMATALNWIGHHCYVDGHPRFEEGSEHHVVYNLEYVTGKHFVHGQAVCLGVFIMSLLQNNEPEKMLNTIRNAGIDITPEALGITWEDLRKTLETLNEFVRKEGLPYTILYEKDVDVSLFETVKKALT